MDSPFEDDDPRLVVRKKLPNDLEMAEFGSISSAVSNLCDAAFWLRATSGPESGVGRRPSTVVQSVRYGSPLEIIVAVPTAILGTAWVAVKVVRDLMSAVAKSAEIHRTEAEEELRRAETRKTDAETELLRLDIEARRRVLYSPQGQQMVQDELYRSLNQAGFDHAAFSLRDDNEVPFEWRRDRAEAHRFQDSASKLSEYDVDLNLWQVPDARH